MRGTFLTTATLAAVMAFGLCACGQQPTSETEATETAAPIQAVTPIEYQTLGDVFACEYSDFVSLYDENHYACAFCVEGTYYRVTAAMPEGLYDSLAQVELTDEAKTKELLSTVAVTKTEVIAESAPSQEELDALAGKTGAELAAEGYVVDSLMVNGNQTDCSANKSPFAYLITFEGAVADEYTTDPAGAVKDMTVSSVGFSGLTSDVLRTAE